MISIPVRDGAIGATKSATSGLYLIQVTDSDGEQARAVLTKAEVTAHIELLLRLMAGEEAHVLYSRQRPDH